MPSACTQIIDIEWITHVKQTAIFTALEIVLNNCLLILDESIGTSVLCVA